MSLLLMMGGSDTPSTRSLFANNEAGLAIDVGDRYGASESKRTWRRNLLVYTDALGTGNWITGSSNLGTRTNGSVSVSNAEGYVYLKQFGSFSDSVDHVLSFDVTCDQSITDVPIRAAGTTSVSQLVTLSAGVTVRVTLTGYRPSGGGSPNIELGIDARNAIVPGGSNSTGYTVTFNRVQLEVGSTPTDYQPITDFNTEFKAAHPTHSLYVDSNGVAPSVYPGDQVGLILDTSRGGLDSLGSELLADTGFDNSGSWDKSSGVTISGGVAVWNTAGTSEYVRQSNIVTQNKWYAIEIDCTAYTSGILYFAYTDGGTQISSIPINTVKTYRFFVHATAGSGRAWIMTPVGGAVATISRFSVREIPGNHAYQTTSGSRPALARTPDGGRRNLWLNSEPTSSANYSAANNITFSTDSLFSFLPSGGACVVFADSSVNRQLAQTRELSSGKTYTLSFYVKIAGGGLPNSGAGLYRDFTITRDGSDITNYSLITYDDIGSGVYRAKHTWTHSGASNSVTLWKYGSLNSSTEVKISGLQLEESSSATAYQKVGLTSDVTESGKRDCWGLLFDGSDDSLQTASVDFNTWTQATRRNLLVDTESFGTSSWTKTSSTVTENSEANPIDSLSTADSIIEVAATSAHNVQQAATFTTSAVHTYSVYAKANGRNLQFVIPTAVVTSGYANFDLINGVVGDKSAGVTQQITSLGNGWYRCAIEFTAATGGSQTINLALITASNSARGQSYLGDGTSGIYLWGAQLEAGTLTDYQRVGTDKMTVMAGVRKNSDASRGIVAELGTGNGRFVLEAPDFSVTSVYRFSSVGTAAGNAVASGFAAPITTVITGQGNIGGDVTQIRANGAIAQTDSTDQGTGNYANAAISIGQRIGNSFRFNGLIYTLIVRGATTPTGTIADFERNLLAKRAGTSW
jgi:hypothetical protein